MTRCGTASAAIIAVLVLSIGGSQLSADSGSGKRAVHAGKDGGVNLLSVATLVAKQVAGFDVEEIYAGRIVSRRASYLGFERSGIIVEINVDEGDTVHAGDLLARLGTRKLEAKKVELLAGVALRRATRKETEDRLSWARAEVQRRVKLVKNNNVPEQNYEEAVTDEKALQSLLLANTAAIDQVLASLKSLEADFVLSTILAPFDGAIVERRVDEGTAINAGKPVLRLIEDAVKQVRVGIPAQASAAMHVGSLYEIEVAGQRFSVRLRALLAILDTTTRTVPAVFEIDDPDRQLRSGQLARLKLRSTVPAEGF